MVEYVSLLKYILWLLSSSLNCNQFLQLEILLSKFGAIKLNTMHLMFCYSALNKININQKLDMGWHCSIAAPLVSSILGKYANNKLSGLKLLFYGVFTTYLLHNTYIQLSMLDTYCCSRRPSPDCCWPFAKLWMNQIGSLYFEGRLVVQTIITRD